MHLGSIAGYQRDGVDSLSVAPLSSTKLGTWQTLHVMAQLVRDGAHDPAIRDEATRICANVPGHDFQGEIRNIFHFCQHHIKYHRDPVDQERIQDAIRTIKVFRSGDCDDKCVCLNSLLSSLGHKTRFKVIGKTPHTFTHVYSEVFDKKRGWIPLDPTPETAPPGWEASGYYSAVYEIFDEGHSIALPLLFGLGLVGWWLLK